MREALLAARKSGVTALDLDFGLGLYDYYADTLPRFFKIVAFVLGIPPGDRERGRAAIARVARGGSLFHDAEARVQMYDIHTYFEQRPDCAIFWISELRRRYPGWPLWGLRLAELLREPLGLFAESQAVCRELLDTAEHHRHVNYQPVVADMARVLLAEALLLDLRLDEARAQALRALPAAQAPAWVRGRAELVVARSLELQGEATAARARYEVAASAADRPSSRRALAALRSPASPALVAATRLLSRSRRVGESGDAQDAEQLCLEAHGSPLTSTKAGCARPARACVRGEPATPARWRAPSWNPAPRGSGHEPCSCSRPRSSARESAAKPSRPTARSGSSRSPDPRCARRRLKRSRGSPRASRASPRPASADILNSIQSKTPSSVLPHFRHPAPNPRDTSSFWLLTSQNWLLEPLLAISTPSCTA